MTAVACCSEGCREAEVLSRSSALLPRLQTHATGTQHGVGGCLLGSLVQLVATLQKLHLVVMLLG